MKATVGQILTRKGHQIFSITPDKPVIDAIKLMSIKGIGAVLVMNERSHQAADRLSDDLVGILSERDYARRVILEDRSSRTTRVEEIMTKKVYCVSPKQTVEDCLMLMTDRYVRHLPVIEDGLVVGVLSIGDIVSTVISDKERHIEQLERYVQGTLA